jgi:amino acid transporter
LHFAKIYDRGWIIPNVLVFSEVLAIAELASSMPLNGSFYWWSGALAPPRWSNLISFVSGWLNVLSMFSATAAFVYAVAASISFGINVAVPDFKWTNAQIMGLSFGVLIIWAAVMSFRLETITVVFMAMGMC